MDIIGALLVGAGFALVIDHPYMQWHYMLGVGITLLVIPRVIDSLVNGVKAIRAGKVNRENLP